MNKYLLDTNVCIHLLKGFQGVNDAIENVGWDKCYISEITVAELLYGAECSKNIEANKIICYDLCNHLNILPITDCIDEFARQKAFLKKQGTIIEDSDIWIGVTAIVNKMIMVTENVKHLERLEGVIIENWIKR